LTFSAEMPLSHKQALAFRIVNNEAMRNTNHQQSVYFLWVVGFFLFSLAFPACKKDAVEPDPAVLMELPGSALLGRGYDVFGDFANPNDVKTALIDLNQYRKVTVNGSHYKLPEGAEYKQLDEKAFIAWSGASIGAYLDQRMETAGLTAPEPYFNKAASAYFDESEYRLDEYDFVGVESEVRLWKVSLPFDAAQVRPLLSAEARADLSNLAPAQLFEKYGTHLLAEYVVGGRVGYYTAAEKELAASGMDIAAVAEHSFKAALGELDLKDDPQMEQRVHTLRERSTFRLAYIGGDEQCGSQLLAAGNYRKWLQSVSSAPSLSGFTPLSLMPIWELSDNPARRTQLLEAFHTYASQHRLPEPVGIERVAMAGITAIASDTPRPPLVEGFRPIGLNLNEGAGGKYIYLYYQTGLDDYPALTDLTMVTGQDISAPFGWTKVKLNLNAGTTGMHIYLCYQQGASSDPVRQFRVLMGPNPEIPAGFALVGNYYHDNRPQNLNEAAGGEPLWLAVSREPAFNP
jgi:hypothetical protein